MNKVWYKWPEKYYNKNWVSWYTLVRRLLFFPIILTVGYILFILMFLGWGREDAEKFWGKPF